LPNQKYEDFYCVCGPFLRTLAKRRGGPSKNEICHLFHLFYQDQIRLGCPRPVEEPWAEPDNIGISATIGHAHCGGPLESLPTADTSLSGQKKAININVIKATKTRNDRDFLRCGPARPRGRLNRQDARRRPNKLEAGRVRDQLWRFTLLSFHIRIAMCGMITVYVLVAVG
jgi:hypothetical protein